MSRPAALAPTLAAAPPGTWLRALRLYSITASVTPVLLGFALGFPARDHLWPWLALPALLGGVLLHLGTNLVNDLGDFEAGVDKPGALGGSGVLVDRHLTPLQLSRAAWACFAGAALLGVPLLWARGLPLALLAVLGLLGGWGYTAGPRYKYRALGDVCVFLLMGPLMVLGGALSLGALPSWRLALAAVPIGLLVTAILHANNIRDLEADRESGLKTVAIFLGRRASLRAFAGLVYGAYAELAALVLFHLLPLTALAAFATLPLARKTVGAVAQAESVEARRRTPLVEDTARLHAAFGLLLVLGAVAGLWLR